MALHTIFGLPYSLCSCRSHLTTLSVTIIAISVLTFDLTNAIIISNNKGVAYAHIFSDTENAVTKNVDGKYQVSFLPYPARPIVNDTSTKLSFSVMENNTDVPFMFTSLLIKDKNTGKIVGQTPYEFHEFGDVTYPYTFQNDGEYSVSIQAKLNADPKYDSTPLIASFDVSVRDMQKMMNSLQELMLFYLMPILAVIVGVIIYIEYRKRKVKRLLE